MAERTRSDALVLPRKPFAVGERGRVIVLLFLAALAAWFVLGIPLSGLIPESGGIRIVRAFFGRALHPAFTHEDVVPEGTPSILSTALAGARRTIVFATAGMSLALVIGLVLGFLASSAWWSGDVARGGTELSRALRRFVWPTLWAATRVLIVVMRSVHELLWAVLFLAAFGLNTFGAVFAIAIPFGGTLAKIFSEMIDEAPRDSANALRGIGAPVGTVFFFGLLPRALPDMCAYSFYRYECAIRSSAVLGFFGFPTLGYSIAQSFENLHYGEVWTYLYALMLLVIAVELLEFGLAHEVRRMRSTRDDEVEGDLARPGESREDPAAHYPFENVRLSESVSDLHRERPKSRLVRISLLVMLALVAYSWLCGDIAIDDMFSHRRAENLQRFLAVDIQPYELRNEPFSIGAYASWAWHLAVDRGFAGALQTLAMSILSITLAALVGAALLLFAARNVASAHPFEPIRPWFQRSWSWRIVTSLTRAFLIFVRAIPEYIWAFLFLAMLGANAWPAILALALHNSGILGKLGAETVENLDPRPLRALRGIGATRAQIATSAIFPLSLSRYLLYVFYRFETCVREATVLGMLGVVSLGYWIQDARSRQFYDQMVLFVALGALIVLAADLFSAFVRSRLRRAG